MEASLIEAALQAKDLLSPRAPEAWQITFWGKEAPVALEVRESDLPRAQEILWPSVHRDPRRHPAQLGAEEELPSMQFRVEPHDPLTTLHRFRLDEQRYIVDGAGPPMAS